MTFAKTAGQLTAITLRFISALLIVASTIGYVASLVLGPILFFYTTEGLKVAARGIQEIPLLIFMTVPIAIPIRTDMGSLFASVWLIFDLCVVAAWYSRGGFVRALKNALKGPILTVRTNFLFVMPLVATPLLYATVLLQQFQATQGVQTGNLTFPPQTSPYVILLNLAFAPINEEIAFRITSIGIPLAVFLIYRYWNDPKLTGVSNRAKLLLITMISPERAKASLGYKTVCDRGLLRGIGALEWILILITSTAFGLAHFLLGGGWEVGKVSTAFLAGLVFGIMFIAYGAYAAILLHWFFDYYFTVVSLAESTYGGVFHVFSGMVDLTSLITGEVVLIALLLLWALRFGNYLSNKAVGQTELSD